MMRVLAPYAIPLFGALCAALVAALGYIYVQGLWLDQAEAALVEARAFIEATKEVRDAQETVPDDPEKLVDWLRDFSD